MQDKQNKLIEHLSKIALHSQAILWPATIIWCGCLYARIFVFDLKQLPEIELNDILLFGFHAFVWFSLPIALFYLLFEAVLINLLSFKNSASKKNIDAILSVIIAVICSCLLCVLICLMLITYFALGEYFEIIASGVICLVSIVALWLLLFKRNLNQKEINNLRVFVLIFLLIFYIISNYQSLEKAQIANFQADVTTKIDDNLRLELVHLDLHVKDYKNLSGDDGKEINKYCNHENEFLKLQNVTVVANLSKVVYVKIGENATLKLRANVTHVSPSGTFKNNKQQEG